MYMTRRTFNVSTTVALFNAAQTRNITLRETKTAQIRLRSRCVCGGGAVWEQKHPQNNIPAITINSFEIYIFISPFLW